MPRGRIDVYLDIVSYYSYIAFLRFRKEENLFRKHGITIEYHPIFLGAILNTTGNSPPWLLPQRGAYLNHDTRRVSSHAGHPEISSPNLREVGNTVLPLRALCYIKSEYPEDVFVEALEWMFEKFWTKPNEKLIHYDVLLRSLVESGMFKGGEEECMRIVNAAKDGAVWKDALRKSTGEVLGKGAYGAPWIWMTKEDGEGKGHSEPVFGSDRFWVIYEYFGVPYRREDLLPPDGDTRAKL